VIAILFQSRKRKQDKQIGEVLAISRERLGKEQMLALWISRRSFFKLLSVVAITLAAESSRGGRRMDEGAPDEVPGLTADTTRISTDSVSVGADHNL
jgi:hypothetical protein